MQQRFRLPVRTWVLLLGGLLLLSLGAYWFWDAHTQAALCLDCTFVPVQREDALAQGVPAAMDSPFFTYSPGWTVGPAGADPPEPSDPFTAPGGTVSFPYAGGDLYLLLAPGDYWAYLYVTVDGQPANRLPVIPGNLDGEGQAAGYKPLLAPQRLRGPDGGLTPAWLLVHQSDVTTPQNVRVEIWRGWGQTPLRGVAVDLPTSARLDPLGPSLAQAAVQRSPAVLTMLAGLWLLGLGVWRAAKARARLPLPLGEPRAHPGTGQEAKWRPASTFRPLAPALAPALAIVGALLVAASVAVDAWFLALGGLALLALAGSLRPALWLAALLFGLPFAFGLKLPLLPNRSFDLIDIGVWAGLLLVLLHAGARIAARVMGAPAPFPTPSSPTVPRRHAPAVPPLLALAAVVSWALVAAVAAGYPELALREWRVVFLTPLLFGVTLLVTLHLSPDPAADRRLLVMAWLAGGALIALFGLWGYAAGNAWVSQAEGVRRIQAFYGSANNLALYLDRTLPVALALALFAPAAPQAGRARLLWALLALPQALAWLLTFSKGSLLLAGPAMALVLLLGGAWLLKVEGRSRRPLWLLLGAGALALLVITPFLGAERFQRLFDLGQGTGFLRLQLWRSALQMGLDHPLLGVGPDNFLYAYRSGYILPAAWQEPNLNHPHNLLLDWWTRLGLPGLLLGLTWLGLGAWSVVQWLRRGPERALALGALAAVAAGLTHGLIDVSYALPDLMVVWVLLFGLAPPPRRLRPANQRQVEMRR
jgi:O-antigen ligase